MMSNERTRHIQQELTTMCELFAKGTTIEELCRKTAASVTTIRARKVILALAGVRIASKVTAKGWNTKVYTLEDSLSQAKAKVLARYEVKEKTKATKKKAAPREGPGKSGREFGWGIESWLFMESDRSKSYLDWCDSWTVEGQKLKDRKNEK